MSLNRSVNSQIAPKTKPKSFQLDPTFLSGFKYILDAVLHILITTKDDTTLNKLALFLGMFTVEFSKKSINNFIIADGSMSEGQINDELVYAVMKKIKKPTTLEIHLQELGILLTHCISLELCDLSEKTIELLEKTEKPDSNICKFLTEAAKTGIGGLTADKEGIFKYRMFYNAYEKAVKNHNNKKQQALRLLNDTVSPSRLRL